VGVPHSNSTVDRGDLSHSSSRSPLGPQPVGYLDKTKSPGLANIFLFKDYFRDYYKAYLTKSLKNLAKIIL